MLLTAPGSQGSAGPSVGQLPQHGRGLEKLEARLAHLVRLGRAGDLGAALRTARSTRLRTVGSRVRVIVEATRPRTVRRALAAAGRVEGAAGAHVQALLPIGALGEIAARPDVRFVRVPEYLTPAAVPGEEVVASNAVTLHQQGVTGAGVKVAVIDGGFSGLAQRQASGDLPATVARADFCRGNFDAASEHGVAVAEIVYEMAPGAQLLLICIGTEVELAQAAAYARSQGAQIINFSAGFPLSGRGDGSGIAGSVVADARANNILWVNAAGNAAQEHWSGLFSDPDGNRFHNFAGSDQGNTIQIESNRTVCAYLKWDEWPNAVSDFDLGLFLESTGQIVALSENTQSGATPPLEAFCFVNSGATATFGIFVGGYRVVTAPRLDLTTQLTPPLEYQVAAGSVTDPGTSPSALTVGAVCISSNVIEPYSSQGPTIDGRVKPDLSGHDSASSATYGAAGVCGVDGFPGTSAAAPEVAGAAALIKQQNPTFDANGLQTFLEQKGIDAGPAGKDNLYGAGIVSVSGSAGPVIRDTVRPRAKAIASRGRRGKQLKLFSQASDDSGVVRITETVKKGARRVTTIRTGYTRTKPNTTYFLLWKPPPTLVGALQHCVQAFDRAGNRSASSCAKLTISAK
ncbi:MAG: S8 family serine peptidase [Gaiellaceae bacterium]